MKVRTLLRLAAGFAVAVSAASLHAEECATAPSTLRHFGPIESYYAPAGDTLRQIRGKPTALENRAERQIVDGTERLVAEAKMHAVYDLPMEYFTAAITDLSNHDLFLPSVTETSKLCSSDGTPDAARQHVITSVGVLFFRATYDSVVDVFVSRVPEKPSLLSRHTLHQSRDGKLYELDGLWYLEGVSIGGRRATYIRRESRMVFAEEQLGLKAALNSFSAQQLKKLFSAVHKEARRRQRSAGRGNDPPG